MAGVCSSAIAATRAVARSWRPGASADPSGVQRLHCLPDIGAVWRDLFGRDAGRAPLHQRQGEGDLQIPLPQSDPLLPQPAPSSPARKERVTLQRAPRQSPRDPALARQLKHDVLSWRDALAEIGSRGIKLADGLPPDLAGRLVHPAVGTCCARSRRSFASCRRRGIATRSRKPRPTFSATTTIRPATCSLKDSRTSIRCRVLLDACARHGSTVYFCTRTGPSRRPGSRSWSDVRALRRRAGITTLPTTWAVSGGDLALPPAHAASRPRALAAAPATGRHDRGIRHRTRSRCLHPPHQEYLRSGYRTHDIAVVMRDSYEFQALLQEEAELQRLVDADGAPSPSPCPPRLLASHALRPVRPLPLRRLRKMDCT